MKDSQIHQLERGQRVIYHVTNLVPPFIEDSRGSQLTAIVQAAIADVIEQATRQDVAILERQESTELKRFAIKALLALMRAISQTARSIDNQFPGIADQFRMPRDKEQEILNRARAYITNATPIAVQFTNRGLPLDFLAELQSAIDAVLAAETRQAAALAALTAATAGIAAALKRERDAVRELDVIMRNRYRTNPAQLAAWKSASHIQRAAKRAKENTTPTPPPST